MITEDRLKHGEDTGLVDQTGIPIREGAILERWYNEWYGNVRQIVEWSAEKGAWVACGRFAHGGDWSSLNGENFKSERIVGHIDETPEMLYPAVKTKEMQC